LGSDGSVGLAVVYVAASVVLGLAAAVAGQQVGRWWL
jgi:fluoride ion exporter CrcB/FEX